MDEAGIQQAIVEYLTHHNYQKALAAFQEEIALQEAATARPTRTKRGQLTDEEIVGLPRLYSLFQADRPKSARENLMEKQLRAVEKNYTVVLQTAKQLLTMAVDATNKLRVREDSSLVRDTIEKYTVQLGRFHQLLMSDSGLEEQEALNLMTEPQLKNIRGTMSSAMKNKDYGTLVIQLNYIRAAGLAVPVKQRRKFIDALIKVDITCGHISAMVRSRNEQLKLSASALTSIISSTSRGTGYLMRASGNQLIQALMEIVKNQEPGSIVQRFALSSLQKLSVWDDSVTQQLIDAEMIQWICQEIIDKGIMKGEYTHEFCLDFGSGLLANLVNSGYGLVYLECRNSETTEIMHILLDVITCEGVSSCVIIHLLVVLTCLANERFFGQQLEQTQFSERIGEFVEIYSTKTSENEDPDNRRTILDMCAHLFHPREQTDHALDTSEVMEFNVKKHQEEIRELEKRLDDENELIVFECFPDEVNLS